MSKSRKKKLEIIGIFSYKKPIVSVGIVDLDISKMFNMDDDEKMKYIAESMENSTKEDIFSGECFEPFIGEIIFEYPDFNGDFTGISHDTFGESEITGIKTDGIIEFTKKYNPKKSSPMASKKAFKYKFEYSKYGWHGFWVYANPGDTRHLEEENVDGKAFCAFSEIVE